MFQTKTFVVVTTTIDSESSARHLASLIINAGLAACVQYASVRSVYRWQGDVESAHEYIVSAKTRQNLTNDLVAFIRERHSYELPEIIVVPIIGGFGPYLQWIEEQTSGYGVTSERVDTRGENDDERRTEQCGNCGDEDSAN